MKRLKTTLLFTLAMVFLAGSCSMFDTRDPESPTGSQTSGEIANSPEEVLERLSESVRLRDPDLYLLMIDSSFTYTAGPTAYPDNPMLFADWDYDDEENFARRLLNLNQLPVESHADLAFENLTESLAGDTASRREAYRLEIDPTIEELDSLYDGIADLKIIRSGDGSWKIGRWTDEEGGTSSTMSYLRATL